MSTKKPHPWGEFLYARKNAIDWMHDEMKKSDYEIAESLCMDSLQVNLIRNSNEFSDHYKKIRENINSEEK